MVHTESNLVVIGVSSAEDVVTFTKIVYLDALRIRHWNTNDAQEVFRTEAQLYNLCLSLNEGKFAVSLEDHLDI